MMGILLIKLLQLNNMVGQEHDQTSFVIKNIVQAIYVNSCVIA
jgi:hypothetical protein